MHTQPYGDLERVAHHHIEQRLAVAQAQRLCRSGNTLRCRTARTLRRLAAVFDPDV